MESRSITLDVPKWTEEGGTPLDWAPGARVSAWTSSSLGAVVIEGNAAGLRALATLLLTLAAADVPPGTHVHVADGLMDLVQPGSREFIVERAPDDVELRTDTPG